MKALCPDCGVDLEDIEVEYKWVNGVLYCLYCAEKK